MMALFGDRGTMSVRANKEKIMNFLAKKISTLHDYINNKDYSSSKLIKLKPSS